MRDAHQASIGARIARLREQQGWSQRALARWVGIDQSAVSRIEAGHRRLSAEELQRFAGAFHVTADVLLMGDSAGAPTGSELDVPPAPRSRMSPSPEHAYSLEMSEGLTPPMRGEFDRLRDAAAPAGGARPSDVAEDVAPSRHRAVSPRMAAPARDDVLALEQGASEPAAASARGASAQGDLARVAGLPDEVAAVARDWFTLRLLAEAPEPAQRWSTGHSAEGKPERLAHSAGSLRPAASVGDVLYDRVARFWRSELHVEPDDGPLPDLVPLLEDGYGAPVIVARISDRAAAEGGPPASSERPVAAAFGVAGVPFVFVNAARPVVLQRFALAHAFAHHVLGHGDVVDRRIEWSRSVPPEAAANDFTEEFLAPVRAVQRWYERRAVPRAVRLEDLLDLANAFGISAWSALFRSRAAGRLHGKQFHVLRGEMQRLEWELLPRQAYLGGMRDTLVAPHAGRGAPAGGLRRAGGAARAGAHARLGADGADGRPPEPRGRGRPAAPRRRGARGAAHPHGPRVAAASGRRQTRQGSRLVRGAK